MLMETARGAVGVGPSESVAPSRPTRDRQPRHTLCRGPRRPTGRLSLPGGRGGTWKNRWVWGGAGLPGGRTGGWAGIRGPSPSAGVKGSEILPQEGQPGTRPRRPPYPRSSRLPGQDNTKPLYFSFSIKSRVSSRTTGV